MNYLRFRPMNQYFVKSLQAAKFQVALNPFLGSELAAKGCWRRICKPSTSYTNSTKREGHGGSSVACVKDCLQLFGIVCCRSQLKEGMVMTSALDLHLQVSLPSTDINRDPEAPDLSLKTKISEIISLFLNLVSF